jgi:hypothetical protein
MIQGTGLAEGSARPILVKRSAAIRGGDLRMIGVALTLALFAFFRVLRGKLNSSSLTSVGTVELVN